MKIEFKVTADLEIGKLSISCADVFNATSNGWGHAISTNYGEEYEDAIYKLLSTPVRFRFMQIAKLTKAEFERAEVFGEDK